MITITVLSQQNFVILSYSCWASSSLLSLHRHHHCISIINERVAEHERPLCGCYRYSYMLRIHRITITWNETSCIPVTSLKFWNFIFSFPCLCPYFLRLNWCHAICNECTYVHEVKRNILWNWWKSFTIFILMGTLITFFSFCFIFFPVPLPCLVSLSLALWIDSIFHNFIYKMTIIFNQDENE